ncbi:MAG: hypothetical protein R6U04_11140 [Bacteroidales bacterium]
MRKRFTYRVLIKIFASLAGLMILSFLMWFVKPKTNLEVLILNKTVPTQHRYNHNALHWVLNKEKYSKSDNKLYQLDEDYYGFFPIDPANKRFDFKSLRIDDIEAISDSSDMVYYADTYGVYYDDWFVEQIKIDPEQKVYGGLNHNDYLLLKEMKNKNKTIITEFVLFESPTSDLIRTKTEELFGLKWEGWIGRYFHDLSLGNMPNWIIRMYENQNNKQWQFENSGTVLLHKYGKVVVMEEETHLSYPIPQIITGDDTANKYSIPDTVDYSYWFDIVSNTSDNEIFSKFVMHTNAKGDSILQSNRLSASFPAILRQQGDYNFYYFAGDFADNKISTNLSYFKGIKYISPLFYSDRVADRRKFFWKFYYPLMKNILRETR